MKEYKDFNISDNESIADIVKTINYEYNGMIECSPMIFVSLRMDDDFVVTDEEQFIGELNGKTIMMNKYATTDYICEML